jgi:hypothetical protein
VGRSFSRHVLPDREQPHNGGLSSGQLATTQVGINLIASTGAELLVRVKATRALPPNANEVGDFEITRLLTGRRLKRERTIISAASPSSMTPSTSPRAAVARASTGCTRVGVRYSGALVSLAVNRNVASAPGSVVGPSAPPCAPPCACWRARHRAFCPNSRA